jgi:hypothetical protein
VTPGPAEPTSIATPAPSVAPIVIEEAGIETPLTPGTYVSRLFEPAVRLELGEGWFRRDPVTPRNLDLRYGPTGAEEMQLLAGADFLQCGTAERIAKPDAALIAASIAAMPLLNAAAPGPASVGDRLAIEVRLEGGGEPLAEGETRPANEFGCVLSWGDEPFPSEDSLWLLLMPDTVMQVVVVDVDGTSVMILGRTDSPNGVFWNLVLDVLASASLA